MPITNLHILDDAALVELVRQRESGWRRAFQILIQRHRGDLLGRCRTRLGNLHDAEDAVQETVLRAYRALHGFKGEASLRTWLFAIADNQCHSLAMRRGRQVLSDHLRELIALMDENRQSEAPSSAETSARVHQALEALPAGARDVLMLRFFRELSIEEIAGTLGIGLSAAKMRLYRALDQFAACYGECNDRLAA